MSKKIPRGRTLQTHDHYFEGSKTSSRKKRTAVVIETNDRNEMAVVPLSSRDGKHRTRMKRYQKGESYFKHFVETKDDEGKPIVPNEKFRLNHKNQDVSRRDVNAIRDKVLYHAKASSANLKKIAEFRKYKKSPRD